jgi:hypothetical protein
MWKALLASIALVTGGMVYVLWRSDSLLMFSWFEAGGAIGLVHLVRQNVSAYRSALPGWFIFSLPQALWLFSGIIYFHCIWGDTGALGYKLWMGAFVTIAVAFEAGQLLAFVPGCFDVYDVLLLAVACLSAWAVLGLTSRSRRREVG